ncbi:MULTISPECIES: GntR family transcriptional regulator [Anaerococcus]|uniref:GntR family transcriptional regulator n=1 Tax=Anaerococcus nagyae TaxID=1755241 RepID=A0A3E2TKZ5_9FIRM|nr:MULTISPECIES: GntR family transcriptional regulator [Anaerococcus]MBP2069066.1 DNA-binding transcriptional regulator YhcF (GntR family) [Anaerococcus nagyae]MDU1828531.1 GntR family transcriptional regulator [Anaerococcus sp.]MDU1864807.1 GntR family transcriptional regulator [Anaerococcus sp.]MDU2353582.1 GntR family transcriptional regulator [Anaerococcus sp.]MDU2565271.1 GntR family transcriptional regulator [Anaerococcus sp.]
MDFDNSRPIYLQLLEEFKLKISTGQWPAGSKIDSVRNLASTYEVNPNTVQKALVELERAGLTETRRTAGRFVTENKNLILKLENSSFYELADQFIEGAENLHLDINQAIDQLRLYWEGKDD